MQRISEFDQLSKRSYRIVDHGINIFIKLAEKLGSGIGQPAGFRARRFSRSDQVPGKPPACDPFLELHSFRRRFAFKTLSYEIQRVINTTIDGKLHGPPGPRVYFH